MQRRLATIPAADMVGYSIYTLPSQEKHPHLAFSFLTPARRRDR
jgi:hypothetical protein